MDRKLLDYLPPVVRGMRELYAVTDGGQKELERLWAEIDAVFDSQFVITAGEYGLCRWEKLLSITPRGADGFETRRTRIMTRLYERLPFTIRFLHNLLDTILGQGQWILELEPGTYVLRIRSLLPDRAKGGELLDTLHRVVPANLALNFAYLDIFVCDILSKPFCRVRSLNRLFLNAASIPAVRGEYRISLANKKGAASAQLTLNGKITYNSDYTYGGEAFWDGVTAKYTL